jgi:arylsulfatase A-like enzyme
METPMHAINRREFLKAAGAGAGLAALARLAPAAEAGAAGKRPNVIVLLTDDQRGDTIAALGNPHIQTPNLDALVKRGFTFRQAYCQGGYSGAVCLPARQMILRGRSWFAPDFKARWQEQNFPKTMNEAGYATFFLGKAGNNDTPVLKVFRSENFDDRKGQSVVPGQEMADGVIAYLQDWKKQRDAGTALPFFMHLAPPHPHDPRVAPKEFLDKYDVAKMPLPPNYLPFHPFDNGDMFTRDEKLLPWPRTEEAVRRELRDCYADITCLDAQIGRIFQTLKDVGEFDNTIFVFTGDQGVAIGSHGLMGKQNLYEDSMKVPVIFAGPGVPQEKASDAFAYHFDIYPTICELTGAKMPQEIDGKSLVAVMQGKADGVRDAILLGYKGVQRAVRRGQWKFIRYPEVNKTQLFDLQADPREIKDLAGDPARADKVKELMALMAAEQKRFGDTLPLEVANPKPAEVNLDFFSKPPQNVKPKGAKAKQKKSGGEP